MHTQWSDGAGSVEDMARAASERGYEYIAVTDHSKGLKIAGGINEAQLVKQRREISRVDSLSRLDLVLGCFHSALRKKEDQTERYLAALRNPDIQILGHPRGRIYNFRLGLSAQWSRVFDLAAELDKAVEIDADHVTTHAS